MLLVESKFGCSFLCCSVHLVFFSLFQKIDSTGSSRITVRFSFSDYSRRAPAPAMVDVTTEHGLWSVNGFGRHVPAGILEICYFEILSF